MSVTRFAILSCGHVPAYRISAPMKGDYVPCTGCDGYSYVTRVTRKNLAKAGEQPKDKRRKRDQSKPLEG